MQVTGEAGKPDADFSIRRTLFIVGRWFVDFSCFSENGGSGRKVGDGDADFSINGLQ